MTMRKNAKAKGTRLAPVVQCTLICLATYIALFAMFYVGSTPEQYDIQVGVPAPTQIKATKDVQDTVTTEALREAAAAAVEPSFKSVDPSVVTDVMAELNVCFDSLKDLRKELSAEEARALSDAQLDELRGLLELVYNGLCEL